MTTGTILMMIVTVYYTFRLWHNPESLKQDLLFSEYEGRLGLFSGAIEWVIFIQYVKLVSTLAVVVLAALLV